MDIQVYTNTDTGIYRYNIHVDKLYLTLITVIHPEIV